MPPDHGQFGRRGFIAAGFSLAAVSRASAAPRPDDAARALAALEAKAGGRLGAAALDTGSGRRVAYKAGERFALCSTFKWLAASAVLARVDRGVERLDRRIPYGKADLLSTSPVTGAHVGEGSMPIGDLCAAAIAVSDNAAANLILKTLGGPAGLSRWLRGAGDGVTRLDRNEPTLNTANAGDLRDTTTPTAVLADLQRFVLGQGLSKASRDQLADWLVGCRTGDARLRAGLPKGWKIGGKTGTGGHGSTNDLIVIWPPARPPVLMVAYSVGGKGSDSDRAATLAEAGRIIGSAMGLT
jgi:beta-lactamase class A